MKNSKSRKRKLRKRKNKSFEHMQFLADKIKYSLDNKKGFVFYGNDFIEKIILSLGVNKNKLKEAKEIAISSGRDLTMFIDIEIIKPFLYVGFEYDSVSDNWMMAIGWVGDQMHKKLSKNIFQLDVEKVNLSY